jgi:hypothetical protein
MAPYRKLGFLLLALALSPIASPFANALAVGAAELQASRDLGCVLAEDALGYLDEEQFNERFDSVVDGFSEETVDIIYAKALGYIDGLLFGIAPSDQGEANFRLQNFSNSQVCSRAVNVGVSL